MKEIFEEERLVFYEKLYFEFGFLKWFGVFLDIYIDYEVNVLYLEFMVNKICERFDDLVIVESLILKDYGFGSRWVFFESGYFEVYNKLYVYLVDLWKMFII